MRPLAAIVSAAAIALSCSGEVEKTDTPSTSIAREGWKVAAEPMAVGAVEADVWTKTYLDDETALKGATLGVYQGGSLVTTMHMDGDCSEGFDVFGELISGEKYSFYMLTGTIASECDGNQPLDEFPEKESDVPQMEFLNEAGMEDTLPRFGLDRCGSLSDMTPEEADSADGSADGMITIPLRCLWAKVAISFDFSEIPESGFDLQGTAALGCNRRLRPFDPEGSKALTASDVESGLSDDESTLTASQRDFSEPLVLYLPENMQGTLLPQNSDPYCKVIENVEKDKRDLLTYLKIFCAIDLGNGIQTATDGDAAEYRILPGADNVANFDVEGGCEYDITLRPTIDGLFMDIWKFGAELTDSRDLGIKGLETAAKATGMAATVSKADTISVSPSAGTSFHAVVSLSGTAGSGTDYTMSMYEDRLGWSLSEETEEMLESKGISWLLTRAKAYRSTDGGIVMISEGEDATGLTSLGWSWQPVLTFDNSQGLAEDEIIPITITTPVKGKTATFYVRPTYDGLVRISRNAASALVAQIGTAEARWSDPAITDVRFSVFGTSSCLELQGTSSSGHATVGFIKKGTGRLKAEINVGGKWRSYLLSNGNGKSKTLVQSLLTYSVYNPTLSFDDDLITLQIDGEPVGYDLSWHYRGSLITRADKDEDGMGSYFAPSLYDRLLDPQVSLDDSGASAYISITDEGLAVTKFKANATNIEYYFDKTAHLDAVAKAVADISCETTVKIADPLPGASATKRLCYLNNTAVVENSSFECVRETRTQFTVGDSSIHFGDEIPSYTVPGDVALSDISIQCDADDIVLTVGDDRSVTVSYDSSTAGDATHSAGRYPLKIVIHNSRADADYTRNVGYMDIFLHATHIAKFYYYKADHHNLCVQPRIQTSFDGKTSFPQFARFHNTFKNNKIYQMAFSGWDFTFAGHNEYYVGSTIGASYSYYMPVELEERHQKSGETVYCVFFGTYANSLGLYETTDEGELAKNKYMNELYPPMVSFQSGKEDGKDDEDVIENIDDEKGDYKYMAYKKIGSHYYFWPTTYTYPDGNGGTTSKSADLGIGYVVLQAPVAETTPTTCHWVTPTEFELY